MNRPEVFRKLRADHRRVLRDLAEVERRPLRQLANVTIMRPLLARMERQFDTHMAAEDDYLFPALALGVPEASNGLVPLSAEHGELRALLASLRALLELRADRRRDEALRVQWRDFSDLLRVHIRKEESLVFNIAEQVLTPRELARIEARRFPRRVAARVRPRESSRKDVRP